MSLPPDYAERVYAGVLGKIIGVYLGRPFEQWRYDRIMSELGTIEYYVHEKLDKPLIVSDDDISGTFTFIRALADHGYRRDITPRQIGQTWLNYVIPNQTILWWGGVGVSSEHTAFYRLRKGVEAPASGSIALNGTTVAEQIGAQIFIDGWAMVSPGNPSQAADLARRAASVSHDREAIYGAQVVASMEALAFVEKNIDKLLDCGISFIPADSLIRRAIDDLRALRTRESDWRKAREFVYEKYGYEKFHGGCHMVPNHCLIILALLWGDGDFDKSMSIVNTCGYDTDCNSGNVGCLLGIRNGLSAFAGKHDWRGPVADRLVLPTADGGRCITDAVAEAQHLINAGRALSGLEPWKPKNGARFHFSLPGSVQGFKAHAMSEGPGEVRIENVAGKNGHGDHLLAIRYSTQTDQQAVRVGTATFFQSRDSRFNGYAMKASPTLYPGQTLRARLLGDGGNAHPVEARLFVRHFTTDNAMKILQGPTTKIAGEGAVELQWKLPRIGGQPIAEVGTELLPIAAGEGVVYLDSLDWDGEPDVVFSPPADGGDMWKLAWTDATDANRKDRLPGTLVQNLGRGLLIQGTRQWRDYEVSVSMRVRMAKVAGLAARVQGMMRYYALLIRPESSSLSLVKMMNGVETELAHRSIDFAIERPYTLTLRCSGATLTASLDRQQVFEVVDNELTSGAIALVIEEGCANCQAVTVEPAMQKLG